MKLGLCCNPRALGSSDGSTIDASTLKENVAALASAGADYLEFPVGSLSPEGETSDYLAFRSLINDIELPIEAFNMFLPGHHRITGPEINVAQVLNYCRVSLDRCREVGADVVVLGSGKARQVPEDFSHSTARQQFVTFCRELGPIAADIGITICIEPLNTREDNLITSVEQGAQLVDEIKQPRIQLLADFYHMQEENEPLENVVKAGDRLCHTHLADLGRVAPGYAPEGEADFAGFFRALKQAGYDQKPDPRCSFEGSTTDVVAQAEPMLQLMRTRYEEA